MTEEALITTIICTYKRPQLLKRAIESALAQTFKNIKICVYDNDSGDETEAVVAEYSRVDKRVFYFKNSENIGAVNNMIQGVEKVNTEFYSLLNDDDFIFPDFYQNAIREFDNYPEAGFACTKVMVIDLVNKRMHFNNQDWSQGFYQPSNEITSKMAASHFVTTGVLLRRGIPQLIGQFDKIGNDQLYMIMAATTSPFIVLNDYGAVTVMHSQSFSMMSGLVSTDTFRLYDGLLSAIKKTENLNIPVDRKVHLLTIITSTYYATLDWKKRNQLISRGDYGIQSVDISIPSQMTYTNLVIKTYAVLPKILHPFLSFFFNLLMRIKQNRSNGITGDWQVLPNKTLNFFYDQETDIQKFILSVNKDLKAAVNKL